MLVDEFESFYHSNSYAPFSKLGIAKRADPSWPLFCLQLKKVGRKTHSLHLRAGCEPASLSDFGWLVGQSGSTYPKPAKKIKKKLFKIILKLKKIINPASQSGLWVRNLNLSAQIQPILRPYPEPPNHLITYMSVCFNF